jgi:hypothetical protein
MQFVQTYIDKVHVLAEIDEFTSILCNGLSEKNKQPFPKMNAPFLF